MKRVHAGRTSPQGSCRRASTSSHVRPAPGRSRGLRAFYSAVNSFPTTGFPSAAELNDPPWRCSARAVSAFELANASMVAPGTMPPPWWLAEAHENRAFVEQVRRQALAQEAFSFIQRVPKGKDRHAGK